MFGILNLNKPSGITSRVVVGRVYRHTKPHKTGHAGTLDPLASGVLLVPVGSAARLVPYLHQLPKSYQATFLLGRRSPSDDSDTDVELLPELPQPTLAELEQAAASMVGEQMQRPPAFSAIKVAGRRAYDLARKGNDIQLPPRPVRIDRITITHYCFPELRIEIDCGSGTYVRSIGRDLAQACQSEAIMSALIRTAIGPFTLDDALPADDLSSAVISAALKPAAMGVQHMPTLTLDAMEVQEIIHGRLIAARPIDRAGTIEPAPTGEYEMAALNRRSDLVAILTVKGNRFAPKRVFPLDAL